MGAEIKPIDESNKLSASIQSVSNTFHQINGLDFCFMLFTFILNQFSNMCSADKNTEWEKNSIQLMKRHGNNKKVAKFVLILWVR